MYLNEISAYNNTYIISGGGRSREWYQRLQSTTGRHWTPGLSGWLRLALHGPLLHHQPGDQHHPRPVHLCWPLPPQPGAGLQDHCQNREVATLLDGADVIDKLQGSLHICTPIVQ